MGSRRPAAAATGQPHCGCEGVSGKPVVVGHAASGSARLLANGQHGCRAPGRPRPAVSLESYAQPCTGARTRPRRATIGPRNVARFALETSASGAEAPKRDTCNGRPDTGPVGRRARPRFHDCMGWPVIRAHPRVPGGPGHQGRIGHQSGPVASCCLAHPASALPRWHRGRAPLQPVRPVQLPESRQAQPLPGSQASARAGSGKACSSRDRYRPL